MKKAIAGILSQLVPDNLKMGPSQKQEATTSHNWHPIAFYLQQLTPAKQRYATHKQEMLVIVMFCRHWRHYLESGPKSTQVLTDYQALTNFFTTKLLMECKEHWWETVASYSLNIIYRLGKTNPADALSRRPDYMSTNKTIAREPQMEHIMPPDPTGTVTVLGQNGVLRSSITCWNFSWPLWTFEWVGWWAQHVVIRLGLTLTLYKPHHPIFLPFLFFFSSQFVLYLGHNSC